MKNMFHLITKNINIIFYQYINTNYLQINLIHVILMNYQELQVYVFHVKIKDHIFHITKLRSIGLFVLNLFILLQYLFSRDNHINNTHN